MPADDRERRMPDLEGVLEALRLRQRRERLECLVLDLPDPLACDAESRTRCVSSRGAGRARARERSLKPLGRTSDWAGAPAPSSLLSEMREEWVAEQRLVCAERGAESPPTAARWRAYLDDDGQVVTFCPECASREFGRE
jgi:hypothetical protein